MTTDNTNYSFSELVERNLSEEARELWIPIAQQFDRDGPEAAIMQLDAQRRQLETYIKALLNEVIGE